MHGFCYLQCYFETAVEASGCCLPLHRCAELPDLDSAAEPEVPGPARLAGLESFLEETRAVESGGFLV